MIFPVEFEAFARIKNNIQKTFGEMVPLRHNVFYFNDGFLLHLYLPYDGIVYYTVVQNLFEDKDGVMASIRKEGEVMPSKPFSAEAILTVKTG